MCISARRWKGGSLKKQSQNRGGAQPPLYFQQAETAVPHAPDSERAIIGSLLLDTSLIPAARERLKPKFFYLPSNRLCFEAVLGLTERGVTLDPTQLVEELRSRGTLEQVGGVAYVAQFTDYAIRSDFDGHCQTVIEKNVRRMAWVLLSRLAEDTNTARPIEEILDSVRDLFAEAESRLERARPHESRLATSWAEFEAESFTPGERIAFAVERGEAALVNALPNAGKTTLSLNAAVSLAAGRAFAPVVTEARERRVLYVDGETRRARLQRDLRTMTARFSREECMAVGRNLHLICEAEIGTESIALTRPDHWQKFAKAALQAKPDFIVIDTMASLCPVFNENDNAEQQRRIWTPVQKLARDCNAALLMLHHVGKRSEDSQSPESVYRGRGASAGGGFARAVWLLIPDPVTPGLSTLRCVKAKGETPKEARLRLGENRWFAADSYEPPKIITALERVIEAVTRQMATAEIKAILKPHLAERATENAIADALRAGKIELVKKGVYRPTAATAATASELFADGAVAAVGAQEQAETDQPHEPQPPIGVGDGAVALTANKSNDLPALPQSHQKQPVRMRADAKAIAQIDQPHDPHIPMDAAVRAVQPKGRRISL